MLFSLLSASSVQAPGVTCRLCYRAPYATGQGARGWHPPRWLERAARVSDLSLTRTWAKKSGKIPPKNVRGKVRGQVDLSPDTRTVRGLPGEFGRSLPWVQSRGQAGAWSQWGLVSLPLAPPPV